MDIRVDDLSSDQSRALVALHLAGMYATSPPEHAHPLDLSGLRAPEVTVWSAWRGDEILGILALKMLGDSVAELKSMRTHPSHTRQRVGSRLLEHVINEATARGVTRLSLETGSGPAFEAASSLYRSNGFIEGEAFSDYEPSDFTQFFHLRLAKLIPQP